MEIIFEQNIEKYDVTFHQELSEITVDILQENIVFETIISQIGEQGQRGKSAYQSALDNGFIGTEQQWLNSIGLQNIDGGIIY